MDKARFKEELRGRIHDFSTSCALTNLSDSKPTGKKEKEIEERYKDLESWIISQLENGTAKVKDNSSDKDFERLPEIPEEELIPILFDDEQDELGF